MPNTTVPENKWTNREKTIHFKMGKNKWNSKSHDIQLYKYTSWKCSRKFHNQGKAYQPNCRLYNQIEHNKHLFSTKSQTTLKKSNRQYNHVKWWWNGVWWLVKKVSTLLALHTLYPSFKLYKHTNKRPDHKYGIEPIIYNQYDLLNWQSLKDWKWIRKWNYLCLTRTCLIGKRVIPH